MIDFFTKHTRVIFIATAVIFVVGGVFVGFGGYFFGGRGFVNAVAEINGKKILYRTYEIYLQRNLNNLRNQGVEITDEMWKRIRIDVLYDLLREEIFFQESQNYGILVTDEELASQIHQIHAFQKDGVFDLRTYFIVLRTVLKTTPEEFERFQRRTIAINKLRKILASSISISENELLFEYAYKHNGDMTNFQNDKEKFYQEVIQEKVSLIFNEWLQRVASKAKIKIFDKELAQG